MTSTVSADRALADYTARIQVNTLEKYPVMWCGHYDGYSMATRCLGQFTVAEIPEGRDPVASVALGMMSPFGMSPEVDASFLIIDALRVPVTDEAFETSKVLYVSRLAAHGAGIWSTHWTVGINDLGFAKPERSAYYVSGVWLALSDVMNRRLVGPTLSWDDAFHAALDVAREALEFEI
jgi:hypothetical protein